MDACARVKGADRAGPGLQACAGFHYVVSGSEQVLADTFYKVSLLVGLRPVRGAGKEVTGWRPREGAGGIRRAADTTTRQV